MSVLPEHLRGDGPCADCGTLDNIVWFTDNVVWNRVTGESVVAEEARGAILCVPCFVARADRAGLDPTGWRLLPDWPWRERSAAPMEPHVCTDPCGECGGGCHLGHAPTCERDDDYALRMTEAWE